MSGMKNQAPGSKLQRSAKHQAEASEQGREYPAAEVMPWFANEDGRHPFDLEERTSAFGEAIIRFAKRIARSPVNDRLINQIVGCGTSIGANCEANEGVSKKDFRNIIGHCVKESKETKFFLRMIATAEPKLAGEARSLYRDAKELHLIFATMFRNAR
jgi:four helix bundle protein